MSAAPSSPSRASEDLIREGGASASLSREEKLKIARELKLAGWSHQKIGDLLGIGKTTVGTWLNGTVPSTSRIYWNRSLILKKFKEWNQKFGGPPSSKDWLTKVEVVDGHRVWPTTDAVVREFGSWNRGMKAAGFEPRPASWPVPEPASPPSPSLVVRHKEWTKEEVIELLHEWVTEHRLPPAQHEWNKRSPDYPSQSSVARLFGSWNNAIKEAGYRPRPVGLTAGSIRALLPMPRKQ